MSFHTGITRRMRWTAGGQRIIWLSVEGYMIISHFLLFALLL